RAPASPRPAAPRAARRARRSSASAPSSSTSSAARSRQRRRWNRTGPPATSSGKASSGISSSSRATFSQPWSVRSTSRRSPRPSLTLRSKAMGSFSAIRAVTTVTRRPLLQEEPGGGERHARHVAQPPLGLPLVIGLVVGDVARVELDLRLGLLAAHALQPEQRLLRPLLRHLGGELGLLRLELLHVGLAAAGEAHDEVVAGDVVHLGQKVARLGLVEQRRRELLGFADAGQAVARPLDVVELLQARAPGVRGPPGLLVEGAAPP